MNPIRILLIEDSPNDGLLVESHLSLEKSFNHTLTRAGCLADGLALIVGQIFDVILTDLGLPDSHGMATFMQLHKIAPHLPIIVLTIKDDVDTALMAIQSGAQDYLPKGELAGPLSARIIRHAIERKELVQKLQDALAEVKTLGGLLPICASCKKIRDDKGYWNQIESYVAKHTDASFTHSYCPDCSINFLEQGGLPVPEGLRAAVRALKKN